MRDYWASCGWRLMDHDAQGRLVVSDDFLRALLERPELAPVPESCGAERALHERLLQSPRREVPPAELAALADAARRLGPASRRRLIRLRFLDMEGGTGNGR